MSLLPCANDSAKLFQYLCYMFLLFGRAFIVVRLPVDFGIQGAGDRRGEQTPSPPRTCECAKVKPNEASLRNTMPPHQRSSNNNNAK